MTDRLRTINDIGIGFKGAGNEHVRDIRVYPEGGIVQVWIEARGQESMAYMTADEAMSFAKAFERCAIQALKDGAL